MKTISIFLLIALGLIYGCDYNDNRLIIQNNSNLTIAVAMYLDSIPPSSSKNKIEYYYRESIHPNKRKVFSFPGTNGWSQYILRSNNKRLNLFFYEIDTLKKYGNINVINNKKLYVDRMIFTEKELSGLGWRIEFEFPPR